MKADIFGHHRMGQDAGNPLPPEDDEGFYVSPERIEWAWDPRYWEVHASHISLSENNYQAYLPHPRP